jgi:hypothetical protein
MPRRAENAGGFDTGWLGNLDSEFHQQQPVEFAVPFGGGRVDVGTSWER